jgi:WD40 repeat protein
VAVGGEDGAVRLLELSSWKEVRRFEAHPPGKVPYGGVWGVAYTPDGSLLTWGSDNTVRLWDTRTGKEIRRLGGKGCDVRGVSADGRLVAAVGEGAAKTLRVWDATTGKEVVRLNLPADPGRVAFAPDGSALAVASGDVGKPDRITLYDLPSGKEAGALDGHADAVFALAFAPDGKTLASAGYDKTIRLWDVGTRKELHVPRRQHWPVYQLAFSRDGRTLASRGAENRVRLWDVGAWKERVPDDGPVWSIGALAWSPDGKLLSTPSADRVWVWDVAARKPLRTLGGGEDTVTAVAFSGDGKLLASGSADGTVHLWGPRTGKDVRHIKGTRDTAQQLALSPDGATLAAWGWGAADSLFLWDARTGKGARSVPVPGEGPGRGVPTLNSLRFSGDGKTLYAGSGTHLAVQRWDVAAGKPLPPLGKHDGGLNAVALAPDGRSAAAVTMGGTLFLWETASGQSRLVVKDAGYATAVAFSPDGRLLALANDGTHRLSRGDKGERQGAGERDQVRLVRVADGKVVARLTGHAGGVGCLGFSPDGRTLASGGLDTTVLLWDVAGTVKGSEGIPAPKPEEHPAAWASLRGDAAEAHAGMARLAAAPAPALRLLGEKLKPVAAPDAGRVAAQLAGLDSDRFAEREEALRELKRLGDAAEPALRTALRGDLAPGVRRRAEQILAELGGTPVAGERLRALRAVEVLEGIADADARKLLRRLADGAAGAWLTEETRASLARLEREKVAP